MRLRSGGIDIFYVDESHDTTQYVVTAIAVPFLRPAGEEEWDICWPDYFDQSSRWRKWMRDHLHIPRNKELHGLKLLTGRGRYNAGKSSFTKEQAYTAYSRTLQKLGFLPGYSILSVSVKRGRQMYGAAQLSLALNTLFQRMRSQCNSRSTNGMVFFDEGHPEYRRLYRRAQVYLPTGSSRGGWQGGGLTKNLNLSMFTKDGNEKNSAHCRFTQIADIVAYAAFLKVKGERNRLSTEQKLLGYGQLYDSIPRGVLNINASKAQPRDGIVRL